MLNRTTAKHVATFARVDLTLQMLRALDGETQDTYILENVELGR